MQPRVHSAPTRQSGARPRARLLRRQVPSALALGTIGAQPDRARRLRRAQRRQSGRGSGHTHRLLHHEIRSILARLRLLRPYSERLPMVPFGAVDFETLRRIEAGLSTRRRAVRGKARAFLAWLGSSAGRASAPEEAQARLARVRLLFNGLLSEFDIFSDVLTQRGEHHVGQLLGGIDFAAADMLDDGRAPFNPPHVITYLDRGHGAAIRRAMTRLPSGGRNPVAVVRVPRERVGSTGLAGSVAHEVGHQASVLLGLVPALRDALLDTAGKTSGMRQVALTHYARWSSELLADFWAVGRVGIAHTLGLFALLTLPRPHIYLGGLERVHPIPWLRVHVGAAMGNSLWPHPQWVALSERWSRLYPLERAPKKKQALLSALLTALPTFLQTLFNLRPASLEGRSLGDLMARPQMAPERLLVQYRRWSSDREQIRRARPAEVFAVLGQARAESLLSPEDEASLLGNLMLDWSARRFGPAFWNPTEHD